MRSQMLIKFIEERLLTKVGNLRNNSYSDEALEEILDDIEVYSSALIDVVKGVLGP